MAFVSRETVNTNISLVTPLQALICITRVMLSLLKFFAAQTKRMEGVKLSQVQEKKTHLELLETTIGISQMELKTI